ncbi:thrombomodulin [Clarias gariepinus]
MKAFLGAVMALALLRVQGRKPAQGNCVDESCVTLHAERVDFNSAQKSCQDAGGHLMTVRSKRANSVVSELLTGSTGNFWIGLKYTRDSCSTEEPTLDLKGYTWITGDAATNFTNWKSLERVCSQKCVSLSKEDSAWTERDCNHAVQGYLCEYEVTTKCPGLGPQFLYETPFGFAREDLQEIPSTSNATDHLGTKYICLEGDWVKAPWNCEVYKGGCEHNCSKSDDASVCTCFPGYKLESNNVSCSRARIDPCLRANCSHKCVAKGQRYACECPNGYDLLQDKKTCKRIDNCGGERLCPEENSYCASTAGGFECRCKKGFRKEKDKCEDEDECFSGPCEHICNNTLGSYQCECSEGYRVSSEDKHKCTLYCPHSKCPAACDYNNPHQCDCPIGYVLEEDLGSYICVDIDECDSRSCDQHCINTNGGYICTCNKGFHVTDSTTCDKTEGISTTPSIIPTSRIPPTEQSLVGGILGIIVGIVILILLIVCVTHHQMKRCGKITTDKEQKDMHALQQVTTENYAKNQSVSNVHYI